MDDSDWLNCIQSQCDYTIIPFKSLGLARFFMFIRSLLGSHLLYMMDYIRLHLYDQKHSNNSEICDHGAQNQS